MPLQKLQFRPGIVKDVTGYTNEGGWRDSNFIRFRFGFPQSIGGWQKYNGDTIGGSPNTVLGTVRSLMNWIALDSSNFLAVGTNQKYYIEEAGIYNDITPIRQTSVLNNPFTILPGGSYPGYSLNVYSPDHGAVEGDYVSFSNAIDFGGFTAAQLNTTMRIFQIVDENNYYAVVPSGSGYAVGTGGGTAVTANYLLNIGLNTQTGGTGWGTGTWSNGDPVTLSYPFTTTVSSPYIFVTLSSHGLSTNDYVAFQGVTQDGFGILASRMNSTFQVSSTTGSGFYIYVPSASPTGASTFGGSGIQLFKPYTSGGGRGWGAASAPSLGNTLRLWSQDNYGEDLIFNERNGGIYYWDFNFGMNGRGRALSSLTTDTQTPDLAAQIMVSDRDRHVLAMGTNYGNNTTPDPLLIRWSSQEDPFTWTPSPTNTAGDVRLGSGSSIIRAVETKREIIVFTDAAAYSLQYVGAPYTFSIQQIASGINVAGYNCFATVDDNVFWMGKNSFYAYAGQVAPLECPLNNYVFDDMNVAQMDHICTGTIAQYSEVWWFYPSSSSTENDRYVVYNYGDKIWYHGVLSRSAWIDSSVRQFPLAGAPPANDGISYIYNQECGLVNTDGVPLTETALSPYIESSPVDIGDGDNFWFIKRLIPDLFFADSTVDLSGNLPRATFVLKTQNYPGSSYADGSSSITQRVTSVPIETFTQVADVRVRGRSMVFRIQSSQYGTRWILGSPRIEGQPDGKR